MEHLVFEAEILQVFLSSLVESFVAVWVAERLLYDASGLIIVVDVSYLVSICLVKLVNRNIIELGQQGLPLLNFVILVCLRELSVLTLIRNLLQVFDLRRPLRLAVLLIKLRRVDIIAIVVQERWIKPLSVIPIIGLHPLLIVLKTVLIIHLMWLLLWHIQRLLGFLLGQFISLGSPGR